MKKRKRHGKRRHSRGTPSKHKLIEWQLAGKCMRVPGQESLQPLSEWRRWFRYEGKYKEVA